MKYRLILNPIHGSLRGIHCNVVLHLRYIDVAFFGIEQRSKGKRTKPILFKLRWPFYTCFLKKTVLPFWILLACVFFFWIWSLLPGKTNNIEVGLNETVN